MVYFNKNKFKFIETFINTKTGKTSGSGFIGVILGLIAAIAFIFTMIGYFYEIPGTIEVMQKIIEMIAAVTILLGVRKVSGNFERRESPYYDNNESNNRDYIIDASSNNVSSNIDKNNINEP
ncbi:hypothetical protein M0Q50_09765 [bacterium]|jgi:hypothetical protein|nr:hypothetical protein [bacterium]